MGQVVSIGAQKGTTGKGRKRGRRQPPLPAPAPALVLLGAPGSGKSSVGNLLTGTSEFHVSRHATSAPETSKRTIPIPGSTAWSATVWDTSGTLSEDDLASILDEAEHVNALVFVLNGGDGVLPQRTGKLLVALKERQELAGGPGAASTLMQHVFFVVTHWANDRSSRRRREKQELTKETYTEDFCEAVAEVSGARYTRRLFFVDCRPDEDSAEETELLRVELDALRQELLLSKPLDVRAPEEEVEEKNGVFAPRLTRNGICGLSNLGNTCYMNSGIQCFAQAPFLVHDLLALDLSEMPHNGVARCWQRLLMHLFGVAGRSSRRSRPRSSRTAYSPRDLKAALGRLSSQFADYGQHDSVTMLSFLIKALHDGLRAPVSARDQERLERALRRHEVQSSRQLDYLGNKCWHMYRHVQASPVVDRCLVLTCAMTQCSSCGAKTAMFDPQFLLTLSPSTQHGGSRARVMFYPSLAFAGARHSWSQPLEAGRTVLHFKRVLAAAAAQHNAGRPVAEDLLVVLMEAHPKVLDDDDFLGDGAAVSVYVVPRAQRATSMAIFFTVRSTRPRKGGSPRVAPVVVPVLLPQGLAEEGGDHGLCLANMKQIALRALLGGGLLGDAEFDQLSRSSVSWMDWLGHEVSGINPLLLHDGAYATVVVDLDAMDRKRSLSRRAAEFVRSRVTMETVRHAARARQTVDDLLQGFCEASVVDDWCDRCAAKRPVAHWTSVWRTSDVLVATLEAFDGLPKAAVGFETRGWDLARGMAAAGESTGYIAPHDLTAREYELFAVSNHFGGYRSGHYTAVVKSAVDGHWYDANDSSYRRTQAPMGGQHARALMYHRKRDAW